MGLFGPKLTDKEKRELLEYRKRQRQFAEAQAKQKRLSIAKAKIQAQEKSRSMSIGEKIGRGLKAFGNLANAAAKTATSKPKTAKVRMKKVKSPQRVKVVYVQTPPPVPAKQVKKSMFADPFESLR